MISKKIISALLVIFGLLTFTSCSDDGDDGNSVTAYDGVYKGATYLDGTQIGSWEINISGGNITGVYAQDGETATIAGSANNNGALNVDITFQDGSKVQVTASISGGKVSGTWTSEDGSSGTLSGEKEGSGNNDNPLSKYDGNYNGAAFTGGTVIGSWQISVTNGSVSGIFSQAGETADISGSVNAGGELDLDVDFGDGYIVSIDATISGNSISGTWSDQEGESGTISGAKEGSPNPGTGSFDGNYSGTASASGNIIGSWSIIIINSQVAGSYSQDGETAAIQGTVNSEGKLSFQVITLEGEITANVNASISGDNISGTWSNSEGESGTISGSKD